MFHTFQDDKPGHDEKQSPNSQLKPTNSAGRRKSSASLHHHDRDRDEDAVEQISVRDYGEEAEEQQQHQQNEKWQPTRPSSQLKRTTSNVLERVASRVTTRDLEDPGPPPDGGLKAWTQVAMGWIVIFATWGYVNS